MSPLPVGKTVRVKSGAPWRPCGGRTGLLLSWKDERYGCSVRFENPKSANGMTVSYHPEELELVEEPKS